MSRFTEWKIIEALSGGMALQGPEPDEYWIGNFDTLSPQQRMEAAREIVLVFDGKGDEDASFDDNFRAVLKLLVKAGIKAYRSGW